MWSVFDSVTKQLKGSLVSLLVKNEDCYKAMHFTYAFHCSLLLTQLFVVTEGCIKKSNLKSFLIWLRDTRALNPKSIEH